MGLGVRKGVKHLSVVIVGFICSEVWEKEGQGRTINLSHTLGLFCDS